MANTHTNQTLRDFFDEVDLDRNGFIDSRELKVALLKIGLPASNTYISDIINTYDRKKDERISWNQFESYVVQKESDMEAAFRQLDTDKTGTLTADELLVAIKCAGLPTATLADAKKMIKLLDKNGSGDVDFHEFKRFFLMLPEAQANGANILHCWVESSDWVYHMEHRLTMQPPVQTVQRFMAGGVAGAISSTITAPLERVRTLMMADAANTNIASTVRKMWRDGGLRGLFKGNGATMLKVIPACGIQFSCYDAVSSMLSTTQLEPNTRKLMAGCTAGLASTVVVYPLDRLRTIRTMPGRETGNYLSMANALLMRGGPLALYKGFAPTAMNHMLGAGIGFSSYEALLEAFVKSQGRVPQPGEKGVIGGISSLVVTTVLLPLEVVSRRLQIQGTDGYPIQYNGMLHAFRKMAFEEGLTSLWRGAVSSLMKVGPSFAASRFVYELAVAACSGEGLRAYRTAP